MSLDAMKQALEVLSLELPIGSHLELKNDLRAAIEQAQRNEFSPDWDAMAVMVEEQQRMAAEIAALRERLAQPEQEPMAWFTVNEINEWAAKYLEKHPDQEPRQWQGLTDEEIWSDGSTMDLSEDGIRKFARAIEAKLKEKNNAR